MKTDRLAKPLSPKSQLMKLTEDQRGQIIDWLLTGKSCVTIKDSVEKDFGLALDTIRPIRRFWTKTRPLVMKWQQLRPDFVSTLGWELTRREAVKKLEISTTAYEQRKAILKFLETGRYHKPGPGEENPASPNHGGKKQEPVEETNPLDDDEKLRQVRIEVFGSAPE